MNNVSYGFKVAGGIIGVLGAVGSAIGGGFHGSSNENLKFPVKPFDQPLGLVILEFSVPAAVFGAFLASVGYGIDYCCGKSTKANNQRGMPIDGFQDEINTDTTSVSVTSHSQYTTNTETDSLLDKNGKPTGFKTPVKKEGGGVSDRKIPLEKTGESRSREEGEEGEEIADGMTSLEVASKYYIPPSENLDPFIESYDNNQSNLNQNNNSNSSNLVSLSENDPTTPLEKAKEYRRSMTTQSLGFNQEEYDQLLNGLSHDDLLKLQEELQQERSQLDDNSF
jgi:hypothetical protein